MINECACLADIGYPHLLLYKTGRLFDEESNQFISQSKFKHSIPQLWHRYFHRGIMEVATQDKLELRVHSLSNYTICKDGRLWNCSSETWVKSITNADGHLQDVLINDDDKKITVERRILVAKAFLPHNSKHKEIIHLNDINSDIASDNLAWGERFIAPYEEQHGSVDLSEDEIIAASVLLEKGQSISQVAMLIDKPEDKVRTLIEGEHLEITKRFNIPHIQ